MGKSNQTGYRLLIAVALCADFNSVALAQTFPTKPIRMVTVEAGGSTDLVARLIAQGLSENLGRQVVVDNRGGASGLIAKETVARASPDGYTLLTDSSALWILPLMRKVPYDPFRDYAPVTLADRSPGVLVVHPSVPANSVKEFIALAKSKPGGINYGYGAIIANLCETSCRRML
jgi:tripartite-type tricarboxylate transporter receptor subunit TctC